ncbi:MAG: M24 family metallopeptidase, partial [Litorimonas sp.]
YEPDQGGAAVGQTLPDLLSLREQAAVRDGWLETRLDTIVPELMREHGIDMWILVAREYLEDPVVATMLNATSMRARRRTILVFHDRGGEEGVERLTVSRYGLAGLFDPAWVPEEGLGQWDRLAEIVAERDPQTLALNTSPLSAFADGLTQSQHAGLVGALPERFGSRIVEGYPLAIGWLERRLPGELDLYRDAVRAAHAMIGEALSSSVITPGTTTTDDVAWWFRDRMAGLDLQPWFHPSVAVQRSGADGFQSGDTIIQPGDLVWMDLGLSYLGLNTDTQHMAYVLRDDETDAPDGLKAGLRAANRVQDALTGSFEAGLSGNAVLARARAAAIARGLEPSIYTHPIGYHGHGAGPAIGFWDNQAPDPRGADRVRADTAWAIESNATLAVPEWNDQRVVFRTEEDAFFDGDTVRYLNGRQTRFHLIAPRDRASEATTP